MTDGERSIASSDYSGDHVVGGSEAGNTLEQTTSATSRAHSLQEAVHPASGLNSDISESRLDLGECFDLMDAAAMQGILNTIDCNSDLPDVTFEDLKILVASSFVNEESDGVEEELPVRLTEDENLLSSEKRCGSETPHSHNA